MATFVLLSKVSSKGAKQIKSLAKMDGEFDRQLQKHCPEVRRMASYALLGPTTFYTFSRPPMPRWAWPWRAGAGTEP